LRPQLRGGGKGVDTGVLPPLGFIAAAMKLAVVTTAKRDRELVTHLASESPGLGKAQMMSICRLTPTNEARLLADEFDVDLVPRPSRFG
jgi:hypothetical protein